MPQVSSAGVVKAQPWWPEILIYWCCLAIAVGMAVLDLAGRLGGDGHPRVFPSAWLISRYEIEVLIAVPFLVVCALIFDIRRFKFNGDTIVVSRIFIPKASLVIPLLDIEAVSAILVTGISKRRGSVYFYGLKCADGRTIKVPAKYVGAKELAAVINRRLNAPEH